MRSLKTTGGLTRGRGIDENQRLVWTLSSPVCAEVNTVMQNFTNDKYVASDQHKDISTARRERDYADTQKMITTLSNKCPFSQGDGLYSYDSGVCAAETVNADNATHVGNAILNKMVGKNVLNDTFKKADQIVTMLKKDSVPHRLRHHRD